MGILVDMSDACEDFAQSGWTDRQVVTCWIGTLTTCLMTVLIRRGKANWKIARYDAVDLAIDYYNNTNLKVNREQ